MRIPHNKIDPTIYLNEKFGRLTVLSIEGRVNQTYSVKAICECGLLGNYRLSSLKNGWTKSCGCLRNELFKNRSTTHGLRQHPLYNVWRCMRSRCYKISNKNYHQYGGKGVRVCDEWKDNFQNFYNWSINNGWQKGLQIDKDIKGDGLLYSPETCSFVTSKVNNRCRCSNRTVTYKGETKTATEWSETTGINYNTLIHRLDNDPVERAFSRPVRKLNKKVTA